jgi:hypothetical protein
MRRLPMTGCALFLLFITSRLPAELIDSFDTVQALTVNNVTTFSDSDSGSGVGMLWDNRYVALQRISGGVGASVYVNIDSAGFMDFNQDSRVKSTALFIWDGAAHQGQTPPVIDRTHSVDLTNNGINNVLAIDVASGDLPIDLEITLYGASQSAVQTLSLPGGVTATTTYTIPLSAFSGVDSTDVRAVTMEINKSLARNVDLSLDQIYTTKIPNVPEPAAWLLAGVGMAGMAFIRRK